MNGVIFSDAGLKQVQPWLWAMLKDAPILVLDEPTEGLDNPTARALMTTIGTLMTERSVLLITHKPEGLEAMDEILVLEQGRIVVRGDHRQLLSALPDYRDLWGLLDEFQSGKTQIFFNPSGPADRIVSLSQLTLQLPAPRQSPCARVIGMRTIRP